MRLRAGELSAGAAAVALTAVLFLDWFRGDGHSVSGWSGLGSFTLASMVIAIALALAVVLVTVTGRAVAVAVLADVLASLACSIASIALTVALVTQPDLGRGLPSEAVELLWPAYVGLALTIAMTAGAWHAMADERLDAPDSAYTPPPPRPLA